jgi:hypothetical protein
MGTEAEETGGVGVHVVCRTAVPPVLPCGSPEQAERRLDRVEGHVLLCGVNG